MSETQATYTVPMTGLGILEMLKTVGAFLSAQTGLPHLIEPVPVARRRRTSIVIVPGEVAVTPGEELDGGARSLEVSIGTRILVVGTAGASELFVAEALDGALRMGILLSTSFSVPLEMGMHAALAFEPQGGRFFELDGGEDERGSGDYVYESEWDGTITFPFSTAFNREGNYFMIPGYLFTVNIEP